MLLFGLIYAEDEEEPSDFAKSLIAPLHGQPWFIYIYSKFTKEYSVFMSLLTVLNTNAFTLNTNPQKMVTYS